MTALDFAFSIAAGISASVFVIWLFALMAAVLVACAVAWTINKVFELINYWRFLLWLNQLHR